MAGRYADKIKNPLRAYALVELGVGAYALVLPYIIDPEGIVRWVSAYDLSVGRSVDEVLRVLDALQTDELCPCNWTKGEATLN